MGLALTLARRGLGRVWPNPAVGCVIVDNEGHIAGRGFTQDGGRPHAETQALEQAGTRARGGTAYVTLEPCAHHGQTPPCAQALINAGVKRVVTAIEDPDARVSGKGHAILRAAGVEVLAGVRGSEARVLNEGFLSRVERGRPAVTLKLATTLDGHIALHSGESRWITGERARNHGHLVRSQHDAVMVGIGTALADDAQLTCRLPGVGADRLVRVVVDSAARLDLASKLATTARQQPVWLLTAPGADAAAVAALGNAGVRVIEIPSLASRVDLSAAMKRLAAEGLTRVLVEGGATLASSLLKARLVDRLYCYRAPTLMGDGVSAVASLGALALQELPRFRREETIRLGEDVLETYRTAT